MVKVIAEIGINHSGSMDECKKMIMLSKVSGCNYANYTAKCCILSYL